MTLELLKFWVINPTKTADTNLCTNPSFETNTTGWSTGGTNTIARSATVQMRGVYSCKCTYSNNVIAAEYTIIFPAAGTYSASLDIYIPTAYDGTAVQAEFHNYGGSSGAVNLVADLSIRDKPQRISGKITVVAGDLVGSLILFYAGTVPTATRFIYIDGVQIESGAVATTYFDGDMEKCYWSGQYNASTSIRRSDNRNGGTLVDLEDYLHISSIIGLGMNPYTIHKTPTAGGRSLYQNTLKNDREFMFIGEVIANNYDELQTKRKALMDLFKPDLVTGEQEVTLRYMATTAAGVQASEIVDIRCRMTSDGLIGNWSKPTQEPITLMFQAYDDIYRDGNDAVVLEWNDTLANADYIVKRSVDGAWSAMPGVTGYVWAIAQHPITKEIYICGTGLDMGGDPDADYLAKWDVATGTWVSVIAGINNTVYVLTFDPAGNLYIGGDFTDLGDANGDRIVMFDGTNLHSLGTGLNGSCRTIAIDSRGYVYVGGGFTTAGGVANTVRIAKWDGTVWTPLSTGLSSSASDIVIDKSNNLYIVGGFTTAGGVTVHSVTKWNGTSFESLGTGSDAALSTVTLDDANNLYVGGFCTDLGGVTVGFWGRWNGQKWEALGDGANSIVYKILAKDNLVYLSGFFTAAGNVALVDKVAVYMGNGIYRPLDINLPGAATTYSLFFDNLDNLYIGFDTTGDAETARLDTITNDGIETRPKITITGPGLIRELVNNTNGKSIYFNNFTLADGEVVTLDFDLQEFTSATRGNILSYILEGISTLDFTLEPGENKISMFIDGTTAVANMTWKVRYWSLDEANR